MLLNFLLYIFCRCFLEFKVKNGERIGRIILELYYDYAPVTVQNFLSLCKGEEGLTYKGCPIHRIIRGQFLEAGDITQGNGRGGFSIYGKTFQEERLVLKHSKAGRKNYSKPCIAEYLFTFLISGVLSMKRIPPTENNSQFIITFRVMERLDHKNVVFGKVIKGNKNLFKIEEYARHSGKPYAEIIISNCGEIKRKIENVGTSASKVGNTGNRIKNCKCLPTCKKN